MKPTVAVPRSGYWLGDQRGVGGGALVSLVITMSSEFAQGAGIDAIDRNGRLTRVLETSGFLEQPTPTGTAREQFKSPSDT
jgi:hypothetical protein